MKKVLFCVAAAAALAGCATNQPTTATEDLSAREYATGSNIPRKSARNPDGVQTYDREALERAMQTQQQLPRPGLGGGSP